MPDIFMYETGSDGSVIRRQVEPVLSSAYGNLSQEARHRMAEEISYRTVEEWAHLSFESPGGRVGLETLVDQWRRQHGVRGRWVHSRNPAHGCRFVIDEREASLMRSQPVGVPIVHDEMDDFPATPAEIAAIPLPEWMARLRSFRTASEQELLERERQMVEVSRSFYNDLLKVAIMADAETRGNFTISSRRGEDTRTFVKLSKKQKLVWNTATGYYNYNDWTLESFQKRVTDLLPRVVKFEVFRLVEMGVLEESNGFYKASKKVRIM